MKVYDYPAFSDSFEKARRELEAAADSPHKGRPAAAQALQSRKVGLWALTRGLTILHTPYPYRYGFKILCRVSDRVPKGCSAHVMSPTQCQAFMQSKM